MWLRKSHTPPPPDCPVPRWLLQEAQRVASSRYATATGERPERLVSGSDDFTLCLYEPSTSKQPITRMTGHVQLINQAGSVPPCRPRLCVQCVSKRGGGGGSLAERARDTCALWLRGAGLGHAARQGSMRMRACISKTGRGWGEGVRAQ